MNISLLTENLNKKIETAISILNNAQNINKELYLFSDFQKTTFIDSTKSKVLPTKNIKLYSFDVGEDNVSNLSVRNLKIENSILEVNKPITFSADINNYSQTDANNVIVSLLVNGKSKARKSVSLNKFAQKKIKFNTTLNSTGIIEAEVRLEEDNIIQDNVAYTIFYVPEKIKILLLYNNILDTKYLNAVFNSSILKDKFEVTKINAAQNSNINYSSYDLLFLLSTNASLINPIKKEVTSGNNLVIIPPANISLINLQLLTRKLKYPSAISFVQSKENQNDYAEFGYINLDHLVFQNLFASFELGLLIAPVVGVHRVF